MCFPLRLWLGLRLFLGILILCGGAPGWVHAQDEQGEQAAARKFNIIATAYNNGLYEKAAAKWKEFIQSHPKFKRVDEARFYLGNSLLNLKKYDEAISTYDDLQQKHPQFKNLDAARFNLAMARFQIASASGKEQDLQQAAKALDELIDRHPDSTYVPRAYYYLGETKYAAGDIAVAAEAYRQLVEKFPDSNLAADAFYFLGVAQQELQKFQEAADAYEKFLTNPAYAKHELRPEINLRQGICLYELEEFSKAEQCFSEVAKDKDSPYADFALLRQGQCRLVAGKPLEAAEAFVDLLKQYPESDHAGAAQLAAGKSYFDAAKHDDAKKMLVQLVGNSKAQPAETAEGAYYLALTHLKLGQPEEALKVAEPAAQKFGSDTLGPYLLSAKADALYEMPQRRQDSLAVYKSILEKFPQHELSARALYMSAKAAFDAEEFDDARQLATRFVNDGNLKDHALRPQAMFIAAEAQLFGPGQTDPAKRQQAEAVYRRLVSEYPNSDRAARAHLRIGWCLAETDKAEEAIKYLNGNSDGFTLPEQQAEAQLMVGRAHAKLSRPTEALAAYDQGLKQAPNWNKRDQLLLESAQTLRKLDKASEAKKRLSELLSKHDQSPLRPQATFELGEIAQLEANSDEAIKRFNEVLTKFGDSAFKQPALFAIAAAHFQAGDFDKAKPPLDQLLSTASDDTLRVRALYLRGLVLQRLNQFEPASKDLQGFLSSNPPQDEALDASFALALCQVGSNNNVEAIATLKNILAADEEYPRADRVFYELGHALLSAERKDEAAQTFEQLARLHADSPLAAEAWFHVGQQHERTAKNQEEAQPHWKAAAQAYQAGLKLAQEKELQEKLNYKLGDMQFRQQQYAAATDTLKKQLAEFPEGELTGAARYLAAESLYHRDEWQQALSLFEQVIQDKEQAYLARALYRAGECAGTLKNWPVSQKHYEQLVKDHPQFPRLADARYGLAYALQNQRQTDAAAKLYEQVAKASSDEAGAKARFMLGEIAFGKKRYDDAIFEFGAVVSGYGHKHWQGLAQFEMARCFNEAGKKQQAIAALEKLLSDYPEHDRAADARRKLEELKK